MACEDMVTDKHSMAGCQSESVHCNKLMTGWTSRKKPLTLISGSELYLNEIMTTLTD